MEIAFRDEVPHNLLTAMTLGPVILRELREQSRLAATYWLRPLGAALAISSVFLAKTSFLVGAQAGKEILDVLHPIMLVAIWLVIPLLVADCISRERREGTLGLLFLTPLKAWEIVTAKAFTYGLRSVALCVAVMPILAITILLGGVSWREILCSFLAQMTSLAWALGAGILASTLCRERNRSLILAVILAVAAFLLMALLLKCFLSLLLTSLAGARLPRAIATMAAALDGGGPFREYLFTISVYFVFVGGIKGSLLPIQGFLFLATLVFLAVLIKISAFFLHRQRQERPPSRLKLWLEDFFCAPAYATGFYYRWLARGLQNNPIGWLEKRRWSGRIGTWIWLTVAVVLLGSVFKYHDVYTGRDGWQFMQLIYGLMAAHMAIIASGSFLRERATGVMELLLISPLNEWQIIWGRLRGIYGQFFASALVFTLMYWLANSLARHRFNRYNAMSHGSSELIMIGYFIILLIAVPIVGLFWSLRLRHYLASLVATVATVAAIPWLFCLFIKSIYLKSGYPLFGNETLGFLFLIGGFPLWWCAVSAALLLFALHRRLVTRNFSVQV